MKQIRRIFGGDYGWQIIATVGHGSGFGLFIHPGRYGGISFALGPAVFDIQPPIPRPKIDSASTVAQNYQK